MAEEEAVRRPIDIMRGDYDSSWPHARITGLHLVRTLLQPITPDDGDFQPEFLWNVGVVDQPQFAEGLLGVLSDVRIANRAFIAGVTVMVDFVTQSDEQLPLDLQQRSEVYGRWAQHVAWDYGATHLRQLVAALNADVEVPYATPTPQILVYTMTSHSADA